MLDRRAKNAEIFKDTEHMYRTNEKLKEVVKNSITNQKLILGNDVVNYESISERDGQVVVSGKRTLEAS